MTTTEASLKIMLEAIFPYKKQTIKNIDPSKKYSFITEFHRPSIDNPILFGIENIEMHGKLPINIEYYFSKKGKIIVLKESGKGFDFSEIQDKFLDNEKYFSNEGEGFRIYNLPYFFVSSEKNATQINFLKFSNSI